MRGPVENQVDRVDLTRLTCIYVCYDIPFIFHLPSFALRIMFSFSYCFALLFSTLPPADCDRAQLYINSFMLRIMSTDTETLWFDVGHALGGS